MAEESKELVSNNVEKQFIGKDVSWRETNECPIKCFKGETDNTIIKSVDVNYGFENRKKPEKFYEQAICELTGTANKELAEDMIKSGVLALHGYDNQSDRNNIIYQALAEYQPRDQHEARLCIQATTLYSQGMSCFAYSEVEQNIPKCEFYLKNATKLLRLHNETIEALNKYRRGGTQNVIVQHVQVNDGGKAVVGNMVSGGGAK